jgi:hypothetical protein
VLAPESGQANWRSTCSHPLRLVLWLWRSGGVGGVTEGTRTPDLQGHNLAL